MDSSDLVQRDVEDLQSTDPVKREAAAQRLFNWFWGPLVRMARARLAPQYRKVKDEEDFAQSVFKSVVRGIEDGRFVIQSKAELWGLLATVLRYKICKHVRDTKHEQELTVPLPLHDPEEDGFPDWLFSRMVSPNEDPERAAVEVFELIDRLPEDSRTFIEMWLDGSQKKEIANAVGCSGEWVRQKWLDGLEQLSKPLGYYVEFVAGRFHAEWAKALQGGEHGRPPEIERKLELVEPDDRLRLFRLLLRIELEFRKRRGELVSQDEYDKRFQELKDEFARIRRQ